MIPVLHKKCGGQIGWFLPDIESDADIFSSKTYMRIDGTHPEENSAVHEICPLCGGDIFGPSNMVRKQKG
jgi:hypothetical protein